MSRKKTSAKQERFIGWWQLRAELLEITPTIWRRVLVPENIRLPALHQVLQAAFGWTNSHLHEFVIGSLRYSEKNPEWSEELKQLDERRVELDQALGPDSRCFDYVYDFGDHWHHVVIVEDPWIRPEPGKPARCIAGENARPPEDVGGSHGYAEFLAGIADPKHEEHDNWLTWAGGSFDPKRFDIEAVNLALAKIKL